MQRITAAIVEHVIHTKGTCPGCGEGGCYAGFHCPCEGCSCTPEPSDSEVSG